MGREFSSERNIPRGCGIDLLSIQESLQ
jgi:hypothetical protein